MRENAYWALLGDSDRGREGEVEKDLEKRPRSLKLILQGNKRVSGIRPLADLATS